MKYFTNVKTAEQLKSEYRKLAMKYHPDRGGSEEMTSLRNSASNGTAQKQCGSKLPWATASITRSNTIWTRSEDFTAYSTKARERAQKKKRPSASR